MFGPYKPSEFNAKNPFIFLTELGWDFWKTVTSLFNCDIRKSAKSHFHACHENYSRRKQTTKANWLPQVRTFAAGKQKSHCLVFVLGCTWIFVMFSLLVDFP